MNWSVRWRDPEPGENEIEELARLLAKTHGEDWDKVAEDEDDWKKHKGFFHGRFRGLNEPFRSDYRAMAKAAWHYFAGKFETRV